MLGNRQNQSEESLRRDGTSQEIIPVLLGNGHRTQLHVAQTDCGQGHHSFHGSLFLANLGKNLRGDGSLALVEVVAAAVAQ